MCVFIFKQVLNAQYQAIYNVSLQGLNNYKDMHSHIQSQYINKLLQVG